MKVDGNAASPLARARGLGDAVSENTPDMLFAWAGSGAHVDALTIYIRLYIFKSTVGTQARGQMKAMDKRKERGDRARGTILQHATQIASREGLEGLTFGRVAADAGVAKGNIQVLFGDKEALQLATIESGVSLYVRVVVTPAMAKPMAVERLSALVEGWYQFVEDRTLPGGCLVHALSNEYRTRAGSIRDRVEHHRLEARQRIVDLLHEAIADGDVRSETDVDLLAFELTSHQASANVAALMDETDQFELARRASRERLQAARALR